MENQLVSTAQSPISVGLTDSQSFELAQRIAKCFAASSLVPKAYQGNLPNCVIALNMASRMGADPMMVMQSLYVVHGTPSWSAQFLIATFNKCGRFSSIRYEFSGTEGQDDWGCRATATEFSTGEFLTGPLVTLALAKKEGWFQKAGSKWQTMPEQMLRYRAAAWFVRTIAPEIAMGLQTAEEVRDVYDAAPDKNGTYAVSPVDLNDLIPVSQPEAPKGADLPGTVIGPEDSAPADKESLTAEQDPPFTPDPPKEARAILTPPSAPSEGQKAKRPTQVEMEAKRDDLEAEIVAAGLELKAVERAVGEFKTRWNTSDMAKIRGIIMPSLKAEKAKG